MVKRALLGLFPGLVAAATLGAAPLPCRAEAEALSPVERCLKEGDRLLDQVRQEQTLARRLTLAAEARALCEKAEKLSPEDPKPLLMLARSHLVSSPEHPEQCLPDACERALQLLARARRLDRTLEHAPRIAFDTAMVYSRMSRFEEAVAEYDQAMRYASDVRLWDRWFDSFDDSMLWGNSAESLMALGRLEESVRRYRKAVAAAEPGKLAWALGLWGLGVALDRDGQVELGRKAIRQVLDLDPAMGRLFDEGVFFEPPGDIWYYTALGHEVAGDLPRAIEHFRRFLVEAPRSQYAAAARRHLQLLERERVPKSPSGALLIASASGDPDRWVESVRSKFERHLPELQLCYDRTLQKVPHSRGLVRFVVTFTENGITADVMPKPGPLTQAFAQCALITMWGWRFEYVGGARPEAAVIIELQGKR